MDLFQNSIANFVFDAGQALEENNLEIFIKGKKHFYADIVLAHEELTDALENYIALMLATIDNMKKPDCLEKFEREIVGFISEFKDASYSLNECLKDSSMITSSEKILKLKCTLDLCARKIISGIKRLATVYGDRAYGKVRAQNANR